MQGKGGRMGCRRHPKGGQEGGMVRGCATNARVAAPHYSTRTSTRGSRARTSQRHFHFSNSAPHARKPERGHKRALSQ
jgi:hypothetical protein